MLFFLISNKSSYVITRYLSLKLVKEFSNYSLNLLRWFLSFPRNNKLVCSWPREWATTHKHVKKLRCNELLVDPVFREQHGVMNKTSAECKNFYLVKYSIRVKPKLIKAFIGFNQIIYNPRFTSAYELNFLVLGGNKTLYKTVRYQYIKLFPYSISQDILVRSHLTR